MSQRALNNVYSPVVTQFCKMSVPKSIVYHMETCFQKQISQSCTSISGRFDMYHACYQCCNCNKELSTSNPFIISQLGFWPGSISDLYHACYQCCNIFHHDLFIHWDILQKQTPGISERSFLKSLELFSKQKGRVS